MASDSKKPETLTPESLTANAAVTRAGVGWADANAKCRRADDDLRDVSQLQQPLERVARLHDPSVGPSADRNGERGGGCRVRGGLYRGERRAGGWR
eukprot:2234319-Rhodomonas_salina.1